MIKSLLVAALFVPLLSVSALAQSPEQQRETYLSVSTALQESDFGTLRQVLSLQPGLTFDALEANWDRAQKVFQGIFPAPDEFAVIEEFQTTRGDHVWIVEMNEVASGSKLLKAYRFLPAPGNGSGWKVSASKQSGSYTYPDGAGVRDKIVEDMRRGVETES